MVDSSTIKLCSWNIHGIQSPVKQKKVLNFLKREKVQIAFIQETHLSNEEHQRLKRDWVGKIFYSSFTSRSRGVAILIHKALPLTEVKVKSDKLGRYVKVLGSLYGDTVSYLNVYAPPICPPDFYTKAFSLFSDWNVASSVIAGNLIAVSTPA